MADKKITGLPELTEVAADDYLEIVDTSTNTNKKISRETLTNLDGVYIPLTNFAGSNATIVGWSGTPAKQITYVVVGKILFMSVYINGTSNATTTRIDLPTGITGASYGVSQYQPCRVVNNGTLATTPGIAILPDAGTYIDFYTNYASAAWTSTGQKQVSGNFAWIIAKERTKYKWIIPSASTSASIKAQMTTPKCEPTRLLCSSRLPRVGATPTRSSTQTGKGLSVTTVAHTPTCGYQTTLYVKLTT